jgi:hypothetical protein
MNRTFGLSAAAVALSAGLAAPAYAALELQSAEDFSGSGLGAVNTVLTLQGKGNASFEAGSVGRAAGGTSDLLQGDVKTGTSQTQTRSIESLGVQSAADLRVVFNAVEPGNQGAGVTLTDLRLNIYSPTGSLLFTSGAFSPVALQDTATGAGSSGFVFALDAADATLAQAAAFGAGGQANLVGLSASVSDASGGAETFYVASNVTLVPEPATYAMLLAGLGLLGLQKRRRREA